jgi:diguanylate cyclase (GGDEF)-like protein
MEQREEYALARQTDRLRTLNEISRVLSSTLDLDSLYDTIYQQVGRLAGTTVLFIALRRPDGTVYLPYMREMEQLTRNIEVPSGPSVTVFVLEHGTPLLFADDDAYYRFAHENNLPVIEIGNRDRVVDEAKVYVPLNTGSRTIGVLSVQSTHRNAYSEEDVQTLSVIAAQAAVAIENARLYEESQDAVRQMRVLLQIAQTINGSLDLHTVLDAILSCMREVVPYATADILLPNHEGTHLEVAGSMGNMSAERKATARVPVGTGVTGTVFALGEPLIIPDVGEFPSYFPSGDATRSEMAVPLKQRDRVIGVLNVERTQANAFSIAESNLLSLFASQAAIAIENARLFAEQEQRVFELQSIQTIVQNLTPLHDVPSIADLIEAEMKRLIDYHTCRLFLLDRPSGTLALVEKHGDSAPLHLEVGQGITGWIAQTGKSILIENTLDDTRATHIPDTPKREESLIGAPLVYQGQVQGVLTLTKLGTRRFDASALRLLEIIAAQAALAFDRARLYQELRTEAVTDPLTQLYNRRYLLDRYRAEHARSVRNRHTLAAIMLDIDAFKRVNDTFGHDAGDVVLKDLAVVLRAVVRTEDVVARYGGEEFCILLPETSIHDAIAVAERLRVLIERRQLPPTAGVKHVTASIGLALLDPGTVEEDLFSRADLAMYEVKRRGGNGVCIVQHDVYSFRAQG